MGETLTMPLRNSTNVPLQSRPRDQRQVRPHPLPPDAPLDGNVQIRQVVQDEVDQRLVLLLAEPVDKGLRRELLALLVRRQPVLREAVVPLRENWGERCMVRS